MLGKNFYYGTVRKIIIAFGALFNDIEFDRVDSGGTYDTIKVPLLYSPKEKFVRRVNEVSQPNSDEVWVKETLPRMGFELSQMAYAPERKTNTMDRISNKNGPTPRFMYNRVPYNLNFSLYIATRKFDDSLRIVEQILPYFTPELSVKIIDKEDFDIKTNIPFILDAVDFVVQDDGSMEDDRRSVLWTLQFTAKCYLYAATSEQSLIKKAIVDVSSNDSNAFYEQYMAEVDPITANIDEPHNIVETISEVPRDTYLMESDNGQTMEVDSLD